MIFEFLVTYNRAEGVDIEEIVNTSIAAADLLYSVDDVNMDWSVVSRFSRSGTQGLDENGNQFSRDLFGFALDLPDEAPTLREVVDGFVSNMRESEGLHIVKFEDPLLRNNLVEWALEIWALEMKLRRSLSIVYLQAYQTASPYDLLRDERVEPTNKDQSKPENMEERAENPFFHLTFSQYVNLNQRPEVKYVELLSQIRDKDTYELFRDELSRSPIQDEDDAIFVAGLKQIMDPIESMRNCCAHSRRPSQTTINNYNTARPQLEQLLDGYLARWQLPEDATGPVDAVEAED